MPKMLFASCVAGRPAKRRGVPSWCFITGQMLGLLIESRRGHVVKGRSPRQPFVVELGADSNGQWTGTARCSILGVREEHGLGGSFAFGQDQAI